jgi:hypothetical protein
MDSSLRRTYPAGVACLVEWCGGDPGGALRFYAEPFGWTGGRVALLDGAEVADLRDAAGAEFTVSQVTPPG